MNSTPANVHLRPMTKVEFEIYRLQVVDQLTKAAHQAYGALGITEIVARSIAEKELSELGGFGAKNNHTFAILNDDDQNVGSLWLFFRGEGEQKTPYLNDLFIAPEFRKHGMGKQALLLLEAELKSQGIKNNIAVHIIGDFNEAAIRLFKSSGYSVTMIKMEKADYFLKD
jgi:GNAT superfamily N-acetyltransferase